jgi:hypothetical protein
MSARILKEQVLKMLARTTLAAAALALMPMLPAAAAGDPPVAKNAAVTPEGAGVPHKTCRAGFAPQGVWLCMTGTRGPATFANAMFDCMNLGARVADYHDWRFRTFAGDGAAAPVGFWLGPITADNTALFANLANPGDFDGETSRFDSRFHACAHDILR